MYRFFKNLFYLLILLFSISGCRKKAFDDYYNPPANAAPPIYQVLQSRGNFKNILALIDRSGFKESLSAGGFWTFFAPNDAAFQKYLTDNNTTIDKIPDSIARKIVGYSLVINAFQTDHIADYNSPTGWVPLNAYKRRTAYYDGFQVKNADTVFVPENRNGGTYVYGDNNNKYIPYFYSTYMNAKKLTAYDYNYFFPQTPYTDFNVVNASVVNTNIQAKNGVIHEIDHVFLPLPSIEQKLTSDSSYSVFRSLYDKYMVSYVQDASYTRQYYTVSGNTTNVYVKDYLSTLGFALGNENGLKVENDDGQEDGYTLFAPTNTVVKNYLNNVLLQYYAKFPRTDENLYKNLASLPINILTDFLNAHMYTGTDWPSKFASVNNIAGEKATFNPDDASIVFDKQFCSNGLFYGVNDVQHANVFSTVYGRAYLDPAYSMMTKLLDVTIKSAITTPGSNFTVFMLSDAALNAMGYTYDSSTNTFSQTVNNVKTSGAVPLAALQRILKLNIVTRRLDDLSGDGIAETGDGSNPGEYIRWHNNTVSSAGTVETSLKTPITITASKHSTDVAYNNGVIYYLSGGILTAADSLLASDIAVNAGTPTQQGPYYDFYQYLINSAAYDPGAREILGVQLGANYTFFIPTQAAMKQAVVDGYLPGTTTIVNGVKQWASFNYTPKAFDDRDLVTHFIYYHILNGTAVAPDGLKFNSLRTALPSMYKDETGTAVPFYVFNPAPGNNLTVEDAEGRTANLIPPNNNSFFPATSNYLGNHALLHQIDNYLRYK